MSLHRSCRFNGTHPNVDPDWDDDDSPIIPSMDPIARTDDGWFAGRGNELPIPTFHYRDPREHGPLPDRHYRPLPLWSTPVIHPLWSTPRVTFLADIVRMPVPVYVPISSWQTWSAQPHDWEVEVARHRHWLEIAFDE